MSSFNIIYALHIYFHSRLSLISFFIRYIKEKIQWTNRDHDGRPVIFSCSLRSYITIFHFCMFLISQCPFVLFIPFSGEEKDSIYSYRNVFCVILEMVTDTKALRAFCTGHKQRFCKPLFYHNFITFYSIMATLRFILTS